MKKGKSTDYHISRKSTIFICVKIVAGLQRQRRKGDKTPIFDIMNEAGHIRNFEPWARIAWSLADSGIIDDPHIRHERSTGDWFENENLVQHGNEKL